MEKQLWDARHSIDAKNPAGAIPKCDAIISAYTAYYGSRKEKKSVRGSELIIDTRKMTGRIR